MAENNFLFAFQGSVSLQAGSHAEASVEFKKLIHEMGALAEARGFRVYYIDPAPFDPENTGFRASK